MGLCFFQPLQWNASQETIQFSPIEDVAAIRKYFGGCRRPCPESARFPPCEVFYDCHSC